MLDTDATGVDAQKIANFFTAVQEPSEVTPSE